MEPAGGRDQARHPLLGGGECACVGQAAFEESMWTQRPPFARSVSLASSHESQELREKPGTVLGSAVTLLSTCIGTGTLALPFAFDVAGVASGVLLLGVFATWSGLASYLLCQCCDWGRCYSYEEVVVCAFGRAGAAAMEAVVIWLLLGAMTSLLVVAGDAAAAATAGLLPAAWQGHRTLLVAIDMGLVMLPLSWAQSLHSLRCSNMAAVACTVAVMLMMIGRGVAEHDGPAGAAEERVHRGGAGILRAIPIIMLSVGCQVQVPCVYGELGRRSLRRAGGMLASAGCMCFGLYSLIAVFGIAAASGARRRAGGVARVPGNVLDSFPLDDAGALAMRAAMAVAVTLVYPVLCVPCRSTVDHLLFGCGSSQPERPWRVRARHAAETMLIAGTTLGLEARGGDLSSVFGLTGATAGALICYLLPPVCYLRMRSAQPGAERASTKACAGLCVVMLVFMVPLSLAATLKEWQV